MPTARKTRTTKKSDTAAPTTTRRRAKSRQAEVEPDEDEDEEDDEPSTSNRRRVTDDIVQTAIEIGDGGGTWTEVFEATGFNGAQLRPHIAKATEATIETLEDTNESVAEHREEGYAWYAMAVSLGKSVAEVKQMAEDGGATTSGRVYTKNGAVAEEDLEDEVEDDEEDDEEEEEEAPAPRRRGRPAKAATATKAAPKAAKAAPKAAAKKRPSKAA